MDKQQNESTTLINSFVLLVMISIPMILFSHKLYLLTSIYVMIISSLLLYLNTNKLKSNILNFFEMRKKLKNLEYYYITDDNKVIDLEIRKNTYGLFQNITMGTSFIFSINFFALHYFIQKFIGSSKILDVFMIFSFSIIVFIGYGGMLAGIVYKHTTKIYVLIPIFSGIVYFALIDSFIIFLPNFFRLMIYLIITLLLYCGLAYLFPVHILRNLNSKTILISSFLTILATFLNQILSFYALNYFKTEDYLLTVDSVKAASNISDTLKNTFLQNTELIDVVNYFIEKKFVNKLSSMMSLVITSFTISYLIGGLLINQKIKKNRLIAKAIFRNLVKEPAKINYNLLIKCSFYGGEEYENLILNNNEMLNLIVNNEFNIQIPDVSSKKRLTEWIKKNSVLYRVYVDFKEIFNF